MRLTIVAAAVAFASVGWAVRPVVADEHHPANDYPTSTRADYVIGCLASNAFKREYLERCSCGIDTIADLLPFDDYEKADTILRMQQGGLGERGAVFRDTPVAKEEVEKLRRAQAEVNLRCR